MVAKVAELYVLLTWLAVQVEQALAEKAVTTPAAAQAVMMPAVQAVMMPAAQATQAAVAARSLLSYSRDYSITCYMFVIC